MFCIFAIVIVGAALLSVTTKRIMRSATYMLVVLFGVHADDTGSGHGCGAGERALQKASAGKILHGNVLL